jgi:hypothetical protein
MIRILYVHGYNGKPEGESFQRLAKYADAANFGGEQVEMHSFDYDATRPFNALRELKAYYYKNDIDLIIASSLGGFLAAKFEFSRRIVVNPCWSPSVELPKIGFEGDIRGYEILEDYMGRFAKDGDSELCIGCFAPEDELLGMEYKDAFECYFKETYEIPGGHRLSEEAAKKIMTELAPMLIERFKAGEGAGKIVDYGLNDNERMQYAHMFSIYNEPSVKKSHMCACFHCCSVFPAELVKNYAFEFGDPETAICPYCMVDSVLADADWKDFSPKFLESMYEYFF